MADMSKLNIKDRCVHLHELHTGKDIYCDPTTLRWLFASDSSVEGVFAGIDRPVMFKETADEIFAEIDRAAKAIWEQQMIVKAMTDERDGELLALKMARLRQQEKANG